MGFNGKSLILIGAILFIFQIANFISIETITPELERAQVLAAIASLIIILIGFLFKQFEPSAGEKVDLKAKISFSSIETCRTKLLMNLHGVLKQY